MMFRIARLLVVVMLGGAVALSTASPVAAKAFSLDKVEITGPGLDRPLILSGRELWSPRDQGVTYLQLLDGIASPGSPATPPGWLGPEYKIDLQLTLHMFRPARSVVVRRDFHPYALGGPVTFTPQGQRIRLVPRRFGGDVEGVEPGWHLASGSLVERLQRLGLPPAPDTSGRTDVARGVRVEAFPWAPVAGSLVVGAALLLVRRISLHDA
jgi:hypothetical protein